MIRSGLAFLAGCLVIAVGAMAKTSAVSSEPLADGEPTIESRLHDIEYPELRKRSADEVAVVKELASSMDSTFKKTDTLFRDGSKGGEPEYRALSGLYAELANAELAWAEGRVEEAYVHNYRAVGFAKSYYDVVTTELETNASFESRCDSQVRLANAKLQLIRAEKVAKAAGVDLTAAKRREAEASKKVDR